MKFSLVVLAAIFMVYLPFFQGVESGTGSLDVFMQTHNRVRRETKSSEVELKYTGKKLTGIFIDGKNYVYNHIQNGWKKFVEWTNTLLKKVESGLTYLGKKGKELYTKITDNIKVKAETFKKNVEDLKKLSDGDVTVKIRDKLVQVAGMILNETFTYSEEQEIAKDFQAVTNLEIAVYETIHNDTRNNSCFAGVKKEADKLKEQHLSVYESCKDKAWESVKKIGKVVWEKLSPVKLNLFSAARDIVILNVGGFNPISALNLVRTLKNIVFNDIPTVWNTSKEAIQDSKKTMVEGSTCIVSAYALNKESWENLSKKLANC